MGSESGIQSEAGVWGWGLGLEFGKIWLNSANIYQNLPNLAKFRQIWQILAKFGKIRQNLAKFGSIWQNLAKFARIWKNLAAFGRIWKNLAAFGRVGFGGLGGQKFIGPLGGCRLKSTNSKITPKDLSKHLPKRPSCGLHLIPFQR